MKNLIKFFGICAYFLAVIGGIGYTAWIGEWLFAIAIIILGIMAWPTFRECFKASWDDKWAKKKGQ